MRSSTPHQPSHRAGLTMAVGLVDSPEPGMAAPHPPDERFAPGSVLDGRYRIDAVLGTGGMGRVYRAEHTKIGKSVAIKVLHAQLTRNHDAAQRFQREAIASGRLDHPNIVGVSDFGVLDDGSCYLVMEILEGESLGDRLERDRRIHWVEAIGILRSVLSGLRHAHERGVVHRDIKPDNVYLARKDGELVIKILDFGIAKLYAGTDVDPASTRAGITVGTPAYLSPEQAVGGTITPRSDLYSASVVLYEMIAGRAPFEDSDPLAMLGAHVSRRPPALADVAPGVEVPASLEEILRQGLTKSPAERISTAADYLSLLDTVAPAPHAAPRPGTLGGDAGRAAKAADPMIASSVSAAIRAIAIPGFEEPSGLLTTEFAPPAALAKLAKLAKISEPAPRIEEPVIEARIDQREDPTVLAPPPSISVVSDLARAISRELSPLPAVARPVALEARRDAELPEPMPFTWAVRSSVLIGLVLISAIALSLVAHCRSPAPSVSRESAPAAQRTAPNR